MVARRVVRCLTSKPPLPLPSSLVHERATMHEIHCTLVQKASTTGGLTPCFYTFHEDHRSMHGSKTFEVLLNSPRKGAVIVGWDGLTAKTTTTINRRRRLSVPAQWTTLPSVSHPLDRHNSHPEEEPANT
uniref:Calreticulin n=1 Tax=Lygus hesperus TaxID=30085 RepID=A0A0A9ZGR8_LYGHE